MFTIRQEFDNEMIFDFRDYLKRFSWAGAKDRVEKWEWEDFEQLAEYLDELEADLTDIQLNDFIWFEWDDIKEELYGKEDEDNS